MNRIKRGMELPLAGAPEQVIASVQAPRSLAIVGDDYVGMKPTMLVAEGDRVKLGQPLFSDKKNPEVIYTSQLMLGILSLTTLAAGGILFKKQRY